MFAAAALLIVLSLNITGCGNRVNYDKNDFIGHNSKEITINFGAFDVTLDDPQSDGLYYHTGCGYISREAEQGFFGTTPPEYFMIYFDENGIACKCEYEKGGWGG